MPTVILAIPCVRPCRASRRAACLADPCVWPCRVSAGVVNLAVPCVWPYSLLAVWSCCVSGRPVCLAVSCACRCLVSGRAVCLAVWPCRVSGRAGGGGRPSHCLSVGHPSEAAMIGDKPPDRAGPGRVGSPRRPPPNRSSSRRRRRRQRLRKHGPVARRRAAATPGAVRARLSVTIVAQMSVADG